MTSNSILDRRVVSWTIRLPNRYAGLARESNERAGAPLVRISKNLNMSKSPASS